MKHQYLFSLKIIGKKMSSATNFAWRFKGENNKLHATVFNVAAQWIKLGKPVYLYNKSKRLN